MPLLPVFSFSLLLHGLVAWRLVPDLLLYAPGVGFGFALWTLLSALLMPMGLLAGRLLSASWVPPLTWAGLLSMGLFSGLLVGMVLREGLLLLLWALQTLWPTVSAPASLRPVSALAVPLLALLVTLLGFWNARRTAAVVRVDVPVPGLPAALHGFRIAQISDIHVGPTIRRNYVQRIVERVNRLDAEVVAITGDLVDGPVSELGSLVEPLQNLRSRYGSFFVTGNHEYYSGVHGWLDRLRALGIRVLMNEHVVIHHPGNTADSATAPLVLAGVTDYNAHHFDSSHQSSPQVAIAHAPKPAFALLLAHQPRSAAAAAEAGFDLQLSGHTHGGQFWPWGYFVPLQQPFTAGLHRLNKLWVYTSRGTGYWGPPLRFCAASEITLLRLVPGA